MNKAKILGATRELLVAIGGIIFAFVHIEGVEHIYTEGVGVVLALMGLGLSWRTKELTIDLLTTTVRKVITFAGIILAGKIPIDLLASITTIVVAIIPIVWQSIEKAKK